MSCDNLMERTRAAVTMLNTGRFNERTKLIAFLMLQHPEFSPDRITRMANLWQSREAPKRRKKAEREGK